MPYTVDATRTVFTAAALFATYTFWITGTRLTTTFPRARTVTTRSTVRTTVCEPLSLAFAEGSFWAANQPPATTPPSRTSAASALTADGTRLCHHQRQKPSSLQCSRIAPAARQASARVRATAGTVCSSNLRSFSIDQLVT